MNMPLPRHFIFQISAAVGMFLLFVYGYVGNHEVYANNHDIHAEKPTSPTLSDDEINKFLFRVNERIKHKITRLLSGEIVSRLPLPVLFGMPIGDIIDTWGEERSQGRTHDGVDIIAHRGELVVSPTTAVVTKIGFDHRGGNFIVTANPGGEQFYFAHLDRVANHLSEGDVLAAGDLLGHVGNTGNASNTVPHLHFSIYYKGIAHNPFLRLTREFSFQEKMEALERIASSYPRMVLQSFPFCTERTIIR